MIRFAAIAWLCPVAGLAAASAPDLLRFTNGDQLHGTFIGIKDGPRVVWQRDDLTAPVDFKTTRIRHVVLHGGRPLKPLESLSHLGLVNGDRIPGTITGLDDDHFTLDTTYAGVLRVPRGQVSVLAANPLGGRVCYYGPFIEDEWKMRHVSFPDGLSGAAPDDKAGNDQSGKETATRPGRWFFSGSAWYWKDKHGGTALTREAGMPDRAVLRFDMAWKNRPCVAVGFHADFAPAKPKVNDEEPMNRKPHEMAHGDDLARLFGNSYVLQMFSNYIMLYRASVTADGKASMEPAPMNNSTFRPMETGAARVELRSNRRSGEILLFINDEFITQWNENQGPAREDKHFAGKGDGFGFVVQGDDSAVRISDIVVAEWNGMPDSARSMQANEQDVVLMINGTDRYAGRVGGLDKDGKILFQGKHGQFHFPLREVAEIRFARERLATAPDEAANNVVVRFAPFGAVSGQPVSSDGSTLEMLSPGAGRLHLTLGAAVMLDFNSSKQITDDWNADF